MDVRSTTRAWSSTTVTHFQEPQPLPPSSNGIDHVLARAHGDPDDPRAHDEVVLRASNLDRKVKAAAVQSKKKAEAEKARREKTFARAVPLRPTSAAARTKPPPPTRKELVQLHERKKMTKELAGELHDMIGVSTNANALSKACLVCHEPPYWFMEAPFTHDASSSGREVEAWDAFGTPFHVMSCPACSEIPPCEYAPTWRCGVRKPWDGSHAMHALRPMLAKFISAFEELTLQTDEADTKRSDAWPLFIGVNQCCFASMCQGIKIILGREIKGSAAVDAIFNRYYKSFIRAFAQAREAYGDYERDPEEDMPAIGHGGDYAKGGGFVTKGQFRSLLVHLCIHATLYEVFQYVVSRKGRCMSHQANHPWDPAIHTTHAAMAAVCPTRIMQSHRVTYDEWCRTIDDIHAAADPRRAGWAPYVRLIHARAEDFEVIDQKRSIEAHDDHGPLDPTQQVIDFREFCEWVIAGEVKADTVAGQFLGDTRNAVDGLPPFEMSCLRLDPERHARLHRGWAPGSDEERPHASDAPPRPQLKRGDDAHVRRCIKGRRDLESRSVFETAAQRPPAENRVLARKPIWARDGRYGWMWDTGMPTRPSWDSGYI